jgi:hypothetical protein
MFEYLCSKFMVFMTLPFLPLHLGILACITYYILRWLYKDEKDNSKS